MENRRYGLYADIPTTDRQQLFETVKDKAVKCTSGTQLCAAIYPWILQLIRKYDDWPATRRTVDSYRSEVYDFKQALAVHLSASLREALDSAVEAAESVANTETSCDIKLSAIMANFVADL